MSQTVNVKGVAQGFHGEVTAHVTLEGDKVLKVEADYSDTAYVGKLGIERMVEEIHAKQSLEVDTVTGASFSSGALLEAARKAIASYEGEISQEQALDADYKLNASDTDAESSASVNPNQVQENTSITQATVAYTADFAFDESYDVIIAGSGGAGLSAAVEASRAGLSVLVCEKSGIPGGTTNYSGGVMQAAGTRYQKEYTDYQNDTPEKHANLWLRASEGLADEALVRDLAQGSPDNIEWLAEMGIEWQDMYGHSPIPYVDEADYAERIHVYKHGGGSGSGTFIIEALLKALAEAGGEIRYDAPVTSLIQDKVSGAVKGALIQQDGQDIFIEAKQGVILATASIDRNPALAKDLNPQQFHDLNYSTVLSAETNTGDGILMGMQAGAAVSGNHGCIDFDGKTGNATNNRIPSMPMIYVNAGGERFVCEDATYAYGYRAIFQQEKQFGRPTYMIFGQSSIEAPGSAWTAESLQVDVEQGVVIQAETVEGLAEALKLPASSLQQTLASWNAYAEAGEDLSFGRQQGLAPIKAPFFAMKNRATNLGSIGGLKINVACQVLNHLGEVIPSLYAAGLNAGGWLGSYYPGSGTAIAGIIHQGRKAAQTIVGLG